MAPLPVTVFTRKHKGTSFATGLTRFFSLGQRKKGTVTPKPNSKPVRIAERSIFMLGFFFGERKSPEQILKAKEIYGKVTKADKVWSLLEATKYNPRVFYSFLL